MGNRRRIHSFPPSLSFERFVSTRPIQVLVLTGGFKKTPISVIFTLVSTERKHGVLGMTKRSPRLPVTTFAYFTVTRNYTMEQPSLLI